MLRIMLEPKPSLIFPHFVHSSYFLDYIAKTHCNCIVGRLVTFGMCIPGKKLLFFLLNFVFISFCFLFVKFLFFHHHLKIFPKGFPNVYHRIRKEKGRILFTLACLIWRPIIYISPKILPFQKKPLSLPCFIIIMNKVFPVDSLVWCTFCANPHCNWLTHVWNPAWLNEALGSKTDFE